MHSRWTGRRWLVACVSMFFSAGGCFGSNGSSEGSKSPYANPDVLPSRSSDTGTAGSPPALTKLYTEHLGQLTGTVRNPLRPLGMNGTDLGVSFARDGKVVFLFGDSWTTDRYKAHWNDDSVAFTAPTPLPDSGKLPRLSWLASGGRFESIRVPTIDLGEMNVPVEAVVVGAKTYLFFSSGWSSKTHDHSRSIVAHASGLALHRLTLDHSVASKKFINVSVVVERGRAWIFGSGRYRKSGVYLARVPSGQIATRAAWRYYRGFTGGAPQFGPGETTATPLVDASCVGELSVRRHPSRPLYFMAYNCNKPRGIHLRVASRPAGPWSAPILIFDPATSADRGYEHFMHAKESVVGHDDGLSEPGREDRWGGEYGPYLAPQWFRSTASGLHQIVYTLSSWNPYQVHLMRTTLGEPGASYSPPRRGVGLPAATLKNGDFSRQLSGWDKSGDGFGVYRGSDGKRRLTTHVLPKGDRVVGKLWQDFTVDGTTHVLSFYIHGGDALVELIRLRTGDVVRTSRGRRRNSPETYVRWHLEEYRGEKMRVLIDDQLTGAWGFVGVRDFAFGR